MTRNMSTAYFHSPAMKARGGGGALERKEVPTSTHFRSTTGQLTSLVAGLQPPFYEVHTPCKLVPGHTRTDVLQKARLGGGVG
jgi:hypothetical protein